MNCDQALLVLLDDDPAADRGLHRAARVHTATCPSCSRAYHDPIAAPDVLTRLRPFVAEPSTFLRVLLVCLAVAQIVIACPWLFGASLVPDQSVAVAHLTRDGAFGLVAAGAALLAAWRSRYLVPALLVGALVLLAQFSAGMVDQQAQTVTPSFELAHAITFVMLGVLAWAAASIRRGHDGHGGRDDHSPPPPARRLHSL
ncbi:MAG: hypothetical protein U0W40_02030 [Acidimicrobiia bacterium]